MVLAGLTSRWQRGPCLLPVTQEETVSSPPALPGAPAHLAPSSKPQPPIWSSPQLALASLTSLTLLRMLWIHWSHLDHPEPPPCLQVSWRRTSVPSSFKERLWGSLSCPPQATRWKIRLKATVLPYPLACLFIVLQRQTGTSAIHLLVHPQPLNCEVRDWIYLSL